MKKLFKIVFLFFLMCHSMCELHGSSAKKKFAGWSKQWNVLGAFVDAVIYDSTHAGAAALYEAVRNSDFESFCQLLDNNIPAKYIDSEGNMILHLIIKKNDVRYLQELHKRGLLYSAQAQKDCFFAESRGFVDVEKTDSNGITPLLLAVQANNEAMVELLLSKTKNITGKDQQGRTVLHTALENNNRAIIELLKKRCANHWNQLLLEKDNRDNTVLHYAVGARNIDFLQQELPLLKDNVKLLNDKNRSGFSPFLLAVVSENVEIVDLLLSHGFELNTIDYEKQNPFHWAVLRKNENLLAKLLEKQDLAAINQKNSEGLCPFVLAGQNGFWVEGALKLLAAGADLHTVDNDGNTILHHVVLNKNSELISKILEKQDRAAVNQKNSKGLCPLVLAGQNSFWVEGALKLVASGADLHTVDNDGNTILHHAVMNKNSELVSKILEKQDLAVVNQKNRSGLCALVLAGQNGFWVEGALQLLTAGADLHTVDTDGNTILHHAVMNKNSELVSIILQKEPALTTQANKAGETPTGLTIQKGNEWHQGLQVLNEVCPRLFEETFIFEAIKNDNLDLFMGQSQCMNFHRHNTEGLTPLLYAIDLKKHSIVTKILKADPTTVNSPTKNERLCPLLYAIKSVKSGDDRVGIAIIDQLIDAKPVLLNNNGQFFTNTYQKNLFTLLLENRHIPQDDANKFIYAVQKQLSSNVFEQMIHAKTNVTDSSLFELACKTENVGLLEHLIEYDTKQKWKTVTIPTNEDDACYAPLLFAVAKKNRAMFDLFKTRGAAEDVVTLDGDSLPLLVLKHANLFDDHKRTYFKSLITRFPHLAQQETAFICRTFLLHAAIYYHDFEATVFLLTKFSNQLNQTNRAGDTPLHLALQHAETDAGQKICDYLFDQKNIDWSIKNQDGLTYLQSALRTNKSAFIKKILPYQKAVINLIDPITKNSPLLEVIAQFHAYQNGLEIVSLLLEHGSSLESVDKKGNSPLKLAMDKKQKALFALLLKKQSQKNSSYKISEMLYATVDDAIKLDDAFYFKKLLKHVDKHALFYKKGAEHHYFTASDYVVPSHLKEISRNKFVDTLGLKDLCNTNYEYKTFFPMILKYKAYEQMRVALNKGFDPNRVDDDCQAPLLMAIKKGDLRMIKIITDGRPTNIDYTTKNGLTALMIAMALNKKEIVDYLLKCKIQTTQVDRKGRALLHYAVLSGSTQIVDCALQYDKNIDIADHEGNTPLIFAADVNQFSLIEYLIKKNADVELKNRQGCDAEMVLGSPYGYDSERRSALTAVKKVKSQLETKRASIKQGYEEIKELQKENKRMYSTILQFNPYVSYTPSHWYINLAELAKMKKDELKNKEKEQNEIKERETQERTRLTKIYNDFTAPKPPTPPYQPGSFEPSAPPMSQEEYQDHMSRQNQYNQNTYNSPWAYQQNAGPSPYSQQYH
ncbi:ankyrin repeat domain-containing protein [bacterium]|nr:MAG: ankyrin repeat domain-containing protein [bacterium]